MRMTLGANSTPPPTAILNYSTDHLNLNEGFVIRLTVPVVIIKLPTKSFLFVSQYQNYTSLKRGK